MIKIVEIENGTIDIVLSLENVRCVREGKCHFVTAFRAENKEHCCKV